VEAVRCFVNLAVEELDCFCVKEMFPCFNVAVFYFFDCRHEI